MKPTLFMYAVRMSWTPMVELVKQMGTKQLIEVTRPETTSRGRQLDKRSNARIGITLKGKYLLRILDEMLRYLDDETPPYINPPLWLMRKALETKGFNFMGELEDLQAQNLLEAPSWLDDPTPFGAFKVDKPDDSVIPSNPKLSPSEKEGVIFTLTPVDALPPIRDYRPYKKAKDLIAGFTVIAHYDEDLGVGFEVKQAPVIALYCPECGYPAKSLRGLSIHAGRMHPDKKKEIMAVIARSHAKVA